MILNFVVTGSLQLLADPTVSQFWAGIGVIGGGLTGMSDKIHICNISYPITPQVLENVNGV